MTNFREAELTVSLGAIAANVRALKRFTGAAYPPKPVEPGESGGTLRDAFLRGAFGTDRPFRALPDQEALENALLAGASGRAPRLIAVVKADAYGHGMVPAAKTALENGADALAVANVDEAIALRDAGVKAAVLVLGATDDAAAREAVARDVSLAAFEAHTLAAMREASRALGLPAKAHLKIDTGMNRIGVKGQKALAALLPAFEGVRMEGIFTHFAAADSDPEFTKAQNGEFLEAVALVRKAGFRPTAHAAASSGLFADRAYWHDAVRPGIALYGAEVCDRLPELTPAQTLSCFATREAWLEIGETVGYGRTFACQRPTRVFTAPVGYGDGYPRSLGNRASALIRGKRVPVIGRVCMDQLALDVTDVPEARVTDEIVLLGAQCGQRITPDELARCADTIPYEIMLGFLPRLARRLVP